MFPFFDPNRILLHSSSMQKYMVRVNKLDNNIPTHTRTYTHIAPGPGVEAHDAARASRGVCGQLLRRAAETPEHVLLSTGSGPDQAQTCLGFGKYALRRPERAFEAQRHGVRVGFTDALRFPERARLFGHDQPRSGLRSASFRT